MELIIHSSKLHKYIPTDTFSTNQLLRNLLTKALKKVSSTLCTKHIQIFPASLLPTAGLGRDASKTPSKVHGRTGCIYVY